MKIILTKLRQIKIIAASLVRKILIQRHAMSLGGAAVIAIVGDLGTGKTTFAQEFARALGIKEKITSPTFTIMKKFKIKNLKFKILAHIDAYRIEDSNELFDLGWKELVLDPKNIILIEWADRIKRILPKKHILIKLKHIDKQKRQIQIMEV